MPCRAVCRPFPDESPHRCRLVSSHSDVEATLVRVAPRAPRILQDRRGVQAPPPTRPQRRAHLHARAAQEAHECVRARLAHAHVLPLRRDIARGDRVGEGHQRGAAEPPRHQHTELGHCPGPHPCYPSPPVSPAALGATRRGVIAVAFPPPGPYLFRLGRRVPGARETPSGSLAIEARPGGNSQRFS